MLPRKDTNVLVYYGGYMKKFFKISMIIIVVIVLLILLLMIISLVNHKIKLKYAKCKVLVAFCIFS